MKRLLLLTALIIAGCGTEPAPKRDDRLYGEWLLKDCSFSQDTRFDMIWGFDEYKIYGTINGVMYHRKCGVCEISDSEPMFSKWEYRVWHTSGNEIFYTDTGRELRNPVETAYGYKFNGNGNLIFTRSRVRVQGEKEWSVERCYFCNIEASRQ
jgi:hypothetical protein